ncbi:MAG: hypothetical protein P8X68_09240 [Desulfobacterales bacterium]
MNDGPIGTWKTKRNTEFDHFTLEIGDIFHLVEILDNNTDDIKKVRVKIQKDNLEQETTWGFVQIISDKI